ncbi:MAG: valine--tRNA ligase [Thermoleophilia bacterium]|nr:valine--tRNA ligase [Thermoleophilia bacterium]
MEPRYRPQEVEERWQRSWEEEGLYGADPQAGGETFVIMHPPPNISGSLTTGHCLQLSLEDALVRWHRMRGFNTLFQPGYDHAGISTWAAIGRTLAQEGKTQRDLGREGFDAYVQEWLERYGGTIMSQFRRLGASLDYRRTRFTMDPGYYRAVIRWFVHLYRKGWIYRANRIVNWCPRDETALSDLEVEHEEVEDTLSYVRYPLADGSGDVTIATVRPATILADVAVAVHPDDERYRGLVGKEAIVPLVERRVPIVADERVEPEFGTGALKVTPGHDPTDFEIGRDHGLRELAVIGPDGRMNAEAGELAGLTQAEADERVLAWAEERGQLDRREPYRHSIGTCERCHTRVEPLIMLQWWCAMDELAAPAVAAVEEGRIRFTPERFARVYLDWMRNVRPWCISRQIWWGHRVPVWYCPDGHLTVAEDEPSACEACGSTELVQDEDVLDTWFSSALYPFATLGWPDETPELEAFYPGDVLTTARDIIFLWVARMIFSGLELIGEDPFHDVLIHSTLLNPEGRRMSRTLGTGIDPEDVLEPYGADAMRYGLLKVTSSQDVRFSFGSIEEGRALAIKLWNVARLILRNAGEVRPETRPQALEERWILGRLDASRAELDDCLARFDFAGAVKLLYRLTFDDFCDWYAEAIKPRLYAGDEDARATGLAALERLLKLLHPVMPHVTEELWTHLPARETRLIVAPWPQPDRSYADALGALDHVRDAAAIFRRSGVLVELEGEERRIFEAVVRLERVRADGGDRDAEVERLRGEVARAERMLANERFVANAPGEVVEAEREKLARYRRELGALAGD